MYRPARLAESQRRDRPQRSARGCHDVYFLPRSIAPTSTSSHAVSPERRACGRVRVTSRPAPAFASSARNEEHQRDKPQPLTATSPAPTLLLAPARSRRRVRWYEDVYRDAFGHSKIVERLQVLGKGTAKVVGRHPRHVRHVTEEGNLCRRSTGRPHRLQHSGWRSQARRTRARRTSR